MDNRTQEFLTQPVMPLLIRMSAPNTVAFFIQSIVVLTEVWFISKLGTNSLAAVALAFPLLMITQTMSGGALGGAITSAIARSMGANDIDKAERLIWHSVVISLGGAFTFLLFFLLFGEQLLFLLGGRGDILEESYTYCSYLFLGGLIISRLGIIISLFIAGILQLLSNLVFIVLAIKGSSISLLVITITIENLSGGIGTAAFIAYLSSLCNVQFSAFQYALLSSFMAFSRTWLAAPAGWLIDNLKWQRYFENFGINQINNPEWVGFFIITALFCLPAIILIYYIDNKRKIN